MNKLGIVLLNWNGHEDTIECINSILSNENNKYTIFLLDNGSEEGSVEYIEKWLEKSVKFPFKVMEEDEFNNTVDFSNYLLYLIKGKHNLGFAKGNNLVLNKVKSIYDYLLILNNDTVITKNAISNMLDYMDNNLDTGVISCDIRLYKEPSKLWNAGGYFTWYGDRKYFPQRMIDNYKQNGVESIRSPFITGCALMARKEILLRYGLFTERFFFGEEDFNYCKRLMNNNIKVESVLSSTIYHKVGTSIKKSQKNINSFILHFSNRIIDFKEFYRKKHWELWRIFYIVAIFFKIIAITKDFNKAAKVCIHVFKYSSRFNEISYETFLEINNLG